MTYKDKLLDWYNKEVDLKPSNVSNYKKFLDKNIAVIFNNMVTETLTTLNNNTYGWNFIITNDYGERRVRIGMRNLQNVLELHLTFPYDLHVEVCIRPYYRGDNNSEVDIDFIRSLHGLLRDTNIVNRLYDMYMVDCETIIGMKNIYNTKNTKMYSDYRNLIDEYSVRLFDEFCQGGVRDLGLTHDFDYRQQWFRGNKLELVLPQGKKTGTLNIYMDDKLVHTITGYRQQSLLRECRGLVYSVLPKP